MYSKVKDPQTMNKLGNQRYNTLEIRLFMPQQLAKYKHS